MRMLRDLGIVLMLVAGVLALSPLLPGPPSGERPADYLLSLRLWPGR